MSIANTGADPGLCAQCRHARAVAHSGAATGYWLCERSKDDARYPKYPRLPIRSCPGFAEGRPGEGQTHGEAPVTR